MPRGDGTGPNGMGSMTGRQAGYCAGYDRPGFANPGFGGRRGFNRGYGRGFGRGFGQRRFYQPASYYQDAASEKEILENDQEALENELKNIKKRLNELED